MPVTAKPLVDLSPYAGTGPELPEARLSALAQSLRGSEILKIAAEIRAYSTKGGTVCDLTVGDFAPRHFPIPGRLRDLLREALGRDETNYPPSNGMPALREAVRRSYQTELGLEYPQDSFLISRHTLAALDHHEQTMLRVEHHGAAVALFPVGNETLDVRVDGRVTHIPTVHARGDGMDVWIADVGTPIVVRLVDHDRGLALSGIDTGRGAPRARP